MILALLFFWSIMSYLAISRFVLGGTEVIGDSMAPTLEDGERLLIDRLTYHLRAPSPGEIVAIQLPDDSDMAVKRIIAGPDDSVQARDDRVWVNGRPLKESYLDGPVRTDPGGLSTNVYVVSPDCYFVLGDNRDNSFDSRYFGAVQRNQIMGRVLRPSFTSDGPAFSLTSYR